MAALDFPSSPTVGQAYAAAGKYWVWDGVSWVSGAAMSISNTGAVQQLGKVVTTGSQSTVTFSSIPQNFTNLRVVILGASSSGSQNANWIMFNNDATGGNYDSNQVLQAATSAVNAAVESTGANGITAGIFAGRASDANAAAAVEVLIPGYASAFQKVFTSYSNAAGTSANHTRIQGGRWKSAAPITDIKFTSGSGTYVDGSTFLLLGEGPTNFSVSPFGSSYVIPITTSFTPFGTGITVTDKSDRMQIVTTSASGTLRGQTLNSISTPYTIDVGVSLLANSISTDATFFGLFLSDGTKYRTCYTGSYGYAGNSVRPQFGIDSWTTATTYGASVFSAAISLNYGLYFVRITDDGTTRKFYVSNNGKDYIQMYSEATNTYLTPTKFGMASYNNSQNSISSKVAAVHWLVSASVLGDST